MKLSQSQHESELRRTTTKAVHLIGGILLAALLFLAGHEAGRRGAEPQTVVRDSIVVRWLPGPVVRDTVREPYPVVVREPADTVLRYRDIDTAALLADYLRERRYELDFSSDSTGVFRVDATVRENRIAEAAAVVQPVIRTQEVYRTIVDRRPYAWEVGAAAGVCYTDGRGSCWVGAEARRTFGRIGVQAVAAWDPRNREPFVQASVDVNLWRK